MLGCVGYGSVFLLAGALFRNPVFPAAGMLIWESVNTLLPALLQKFSVIYYLKSLCPMEAPIEGGSFASMLVVNADPVSPFIAIAGNPRSIDSHAERRNRATVRGVAHLGTTAQSANDHDFVESTGHAQPPYRRASRRRG